MNSPGLRKAVPTQILEILRERGPMTAEFLARTLPEEKKETIKRSLGRLHKGEKVRGVSLNRNNFFYHLPFESKTPHGSTSLNHPTLRKLEWLHNQWVEYWIALLKRDFPEAQVIRERQMPYDSRSQEILSSASLGGFLLPDFLFCLKNQDEQRMIYVAFEIERTRKTNHRVLAKMRRYLNETQIDGLVYISDAGGITRAARNLYLQQNKESSIRSKHYQNFFFLFSESVLGEKVDYPPLFTAHQKRIEIRDWIQTLSRIPWSKRRESDFKTLSPRGQIATERERDN